MSDDFPLPFLPVEVECGHDVDPVEAARLSGDDDDGKLEVDDYWRKHPDAEDLG